MGGQRSEPLAPHGHVRLATRRSALRNNLNAQTQGASRKGHAPASVSTSSSVKLTLASRMCSSWKPRHVPWIGNTSPAGRARAGRPAQWAAAGSGLGSPRGPCLYLRMPPGCPPCDRLPSLRPAALLATGCFRPAATGRSYVLPLRPPASLASFAQFHSLRAATTSAGRWQQRRTHGRAQQVSRALRARVSHTVVLLPISAHQRSSRQGAAAARRCSRGSSRRALPRGTQEARPGRHPQGESIQRSVRPPGKMIPFTLLNSRRSSASEW